MGKSTSFLSVLSRVFPCFCQTNRTEPARKVVQDDKVTHSNLYEVPDMIFSLSYLVFDYYRASDMGKSTSFLRVHSRRFPVFSPTNRPEPARKVVQDDKVTHTNLYEGPGMIFQPLLSRFRLLQSLRHGKKYINS